MPTSQEVCQAWQKAQTIQLQEHWSQWVEFKKSVARAGGSEYAMPLEMIQADDWASLMACAAIDDIRLCGHFRAVSFIQESYQIKTVLEKVVLIDTLLRSDMMQHKHIRVEALWSSLVSYAPLTSIFDLVQSTLSDWKRKLTKQKISDQALKSLVTEWWPRYKKKHWLEKGFLYGLGALTFIGLLGGAYVITVGEWTHVLKPKSWKNILEFVATLGVLVLLSWSVYIVWALRKKIKGDACFHSILLGDCVCDAKDFAVQVDSVQGLHSVIPHRQEECRSVSVPK